MTQTKAQLQAQLDATLAECARLRADIAARDATLSKARVEYRDLRDRARAAYVALRTKARAYAMVHP